MKKICLLGQLLGTQRSGVTCRVTMNETVVYNGPVEEPSDHETFGGIGCLAEFDLPDSIRGQVNMGIEVFNGAMTFAMLGERVSYAQLDSNGDPVLDANGNPVMETATMELEYSDDQAHLCAVSSAVADGVAVSPWTNIKNGINDTRGRHYEFDLTFACQYQLVNLST